MRLNGVPGGSSTALTVASTATKFIPGAQPLSVGLTMLNFAAGLFGGHVSRPKYYVDITVSNNGATATRMYGNSDAKGDNAAVTPGLQFANAIIDLTKQFNGSIIKPFNLGGKYMQKYNSFGITIGQPSGKEATEFNILFDHPDSNGVEDGVALAFILAVKRGFIQLDNAYQNLVANIDPGKIAFNIGIPKVAAQLAQIKNGTMQQIQTPAPQLMKPPGYDFLTYNSLPPEQTVRPAATNYLPYIIGGVLLFAALG